MDVHEASGMVGAYLDEPLSKFLEKLENDGLIDDDTIVTIFADHGGHTSFLENLFRV
jgi:phosphoglycerol transferase MdoB-like AlkP superfamily enzyme